jgi:hypothetical protein
MRKLKICSSDCLIQQGAGSPQPWYCQMSLPDMPNGRCAAPWPSGKAEVRRSEPPRLSRRLQHERGWNLWEQQSGIQLRLGSGLYGWSWSTRLSTARSGQRSFRFRARLAARPRRCIAGWPQAERDHGKRAGLSSAKRERLKDLERENRELKRSSDILRKASAYFAQAELDRRGK